MDRPLLDIVREAAAGFHALDCPAVVYTHKDPGALKIDLSVIGWGICDVLNEEARDSGLFYTVRPMPERVDFLIETL